MSARAWPRHLSAALVAAALGALAVVAVADPPKGGYPPDPPSQSTRKQWLFDVTIKGGVVAAARARGVLRDKPAGSARVFGRFAVELWVGKELLDRVRFNVPLTGDDRDPSGMENDPDRRTDRSPFRRPTFEKVSTRTVVQIADSPRASWAQVIDRASGATRKYWWPPEPDGTLLPMLPAGADAGAPVPATDGGAASAADGGAKAPIAADGGAPSPSDGGAPIPPRDAAAPQPPRDGGAPQPPRDGGAAPLAPSADGGRR